MAKRGRPRGINLNPAAVEDLLAKACISKGELAAAAGVSTGHLADLLYRGKGTSAAVVRKMATALRCQPATLAPTLGGSFLAIRPGDEAA